MTFLLKSPLKTALDYQVLHQPDNKTVSSSLKASSVNISLAFCQLSCSPMNLLSEMLPVIDEKMYVLNFTATL